MRLRWSEAASHHLEQIYDYVAESSQSAAASTIAELFEAAEQLEQHPRLGHAGRREDTRELIHGAYILINELAGDMCNMLAVLHGKRRHGA